MNDGIPLTLGRSFWAIDPMALPRVIEARLHPEFDWEAVANAFPPQIMAIQKKPDGRAGGGVAVIPLSGVITPQPSLLSLLFGGGGGGLEEFRANFRDAVADPDVASIVLDIDSPGGVVQGVPEMANEIRAARGSKPIVAVANNHANSAAYWIGSQADEVVVTPSGTVGSVGVYMVHTDYSAMNEKMGVNPTYISAGKYKVEGNPDSSLSDEARADWQQDTDLLYGMFVDDVGAGRQVSATQVREAYGEGRSLLAPRALEAGLVDRVDSLENVVTGLLHSVGAHRPEARALVTPNEARAQLKDCFLTEEEFKAVGEIMGWLPKVEEPEPETEPEVSEDEESEEEDESNRPYFPELEFAD